MSSGARNVIRAAFRPRDRRLPRYEWISMTQDVYMARSTTGVAASEALDPLAPP